MSPKPLMPPFDSEAYIEGSIDFFQILSGQSYHSFEIQRNGPVFNMREIYTDYYKKALEEKISLDTIEEHRRDIDNHLLSITITPEMYEKESISNKVNMLFTYPPEKVDIFNPLMPMVRMFCLYAAMSNVYKEKGDTEQSLAFGVFAAYITGMLYRYHYELISSGWIDSIKFNSDQGKTIKKKQEIRKTTASGGIKKGEIAQSLAEEYWTRCKALPQFNSLLKKYSKSRQKLSDNLYDLINSTKETDELKKVRYGRSWFYKNVIKKNIALT